MVSFYGPVFFSLGADGNGGGVVLLSSTFPTYSIWCHVWFRCTVHKRVTCWFNTQVKSGLIDPKMFIFPSLSICACDINKVVDFSRVIRLPGQIYSPDKSTLFIRLMQRNHTLSSSSFLWFKRGPLTIDAWLPKSHLLQWRHRSKAHTI